MKNDSLYQQTKKARKDQRVAVDKESKVYDERDAAVKEATKDMIPYSFEYIGTVALLDERFEKKLEKAEKAHEKADKTLLRLGKKFHNYSLFNSFDIVQCMATFMTYIEGERFIPAHSTEALQNSIIIRRSAVKDKEELEPGINGVHPNISEEDLQDAYYNGDAILLDNGYSNGVDLYNELGTLNYSIGNYIYLHEFFNRLILHRIKHDIKGYVAGSDWIYQYMAKYLKKHPELVLMNKEKRAAMLVGEQDEYTEGCATLELLKGDE